MQNVTAEGVQMRLALLLVLVGCATPAQTFEERTANCEWIGELVDGYRTELVAGVCTLIEDKP
jgi:hypothetical protein